jgi:hypothetical protein
MMALGSGMVRANIVDLVPGKKYLVKARRRVLTNSNLGFAMNMNNVLCMYDNAYTSDPGLADTYQETTYFGYYQPANDETYSQMKLDTGGLSGARVDYVKFVPTSDIYFDERIATYVNSAGPYTFVVSSPYNNSLPANGTNNGMILASGANNYVTGTVTLDTTKTYRVYACRQVHSSGQLRYDVSFNDVLFASDSAALTPNDTLVETYLGNYQPTSSQITVKLNNAGAWFARVDYIRFEVIN